MTYREWIQGYPDEDLGGFIELKMETYNKICERLAYLEENAEKYRWHDLRKNLKDLPKIGEEVKICVERKEYCSDGNVSIKYTYESAFLEYFEFKKVTVFTVLPSYVRYADVDEFINRHGFKYEEKRIETASEGIVAWRYIEPFEVSE